MRVLFASACVWLVQAANDISIVGSTVEAFSTNFVFSAKNMPVHLLQTGFAGFKNDLAQLTTIVDQIWIDGLLQFDYATKKLKVTARTTVDLASATAASGSAVNASASAVVLVDVVNAKVSISETGSATMLWPDGTNAPKSKHYCETKAIPTWRAQGLTRWLNNINLKKFSTKLNTFPHTTAGGIATFSTPVATVSMKTTGVPVSVVWSKKVTVGGSASLTFSNWVSSSGDMTGPSCTSSEMDEEFIGGILGSSDLVDLLEVPGGFAGLSEMLAEPRGDDDSFWMMASVFFIAGISGAALVLALVKVSTRKNGQYSPLLDEV